MPESVIAKPRQGLWQSVSPWDITDSHNQCAHWFRNDRLVCIFQQALFQHWSLCIISRRSRSMIRFSRRLM